MNTPEFRRMQLKQEIYAMELSLYHKKLELESVEKECTEKSNLFAPATFVFNANTIIFKVPDQFANKNFSQ